MKAFTSNVDGVGQQAGYATETGAYDWAHAILDSRNDKTACVQIAAPFAIVYDPKTELPRSSAFKSSRNSSVTPKQYDQNP